VTIKKEKRRIIIPLHVKIHNMLYEKYIYQNKNKIREKSGIV